MKKKLILCLKIFLLVFFMLPYNACNQYGRAITVSWIDATGKLIEKTYIDKSEDLIERELPVDTDEWHYTSWKIVESSDLIICVAQRVKKIHYLWEDHNQSILQEVMGFEGQEYEFPELPVSTDKWKYSDWEKEINGNQVIYTVQQTPNENYFVGNVFQIIIKDETNQPVSSGTGFIINEDGWFVTNHHVMEGANSATAYFDIENQEAKKEYTQLPVLGGVYSSSEKDIFIGKLSNYETINSYYQNISFTESYEIGETTYTVGYPNSSLFMEINQGVLLEEYKDIYGKIYDSYYLLSDSYIAPGSSGGILVNEKFEVIGITTMGLYSDGDKTVFLAGGSVPTSLFLKDMQNLDETDLKLLNKIYD